MPRCMTWRLSINTRSPGDHVFINTQPLDRGIDECFDRSPRAAVLSLNAGGGVGKIQGDASGHRMRQQHEVLGVGRQFLWRGAFEVTDLGGAHPDVRSVQLRTNGRVQRFERGPCVQKTGVPSHRGHLDAREKIEDEVLSRTPEIAVVVPVLGELDRGNDAAVGAHVSDARDAGECRLGIRKG